MNQSNQFKYLGKNDQQLRSWFNAKFRQQKIGRMDVDDFIDWYRKAEKKCEYCGLTEEESQKIVREGKCRSKRFPQNGFHGKGTSRGMWLEVDKYDPHGKYEIANIVLACYFCNNDKSDIFHGNDYKQFVMDRVGFLKKLIS